MTLDLLPSRAPPAPAPPPVVAPEPVLPHEPALPPEPPALPEPAGRSFAANPEVIWLDDSTYVEREYRAGYHDYSLWEEGRDGYGYHRETIIRSVRWGRVDTRYSYVARFTVEQLGEAIVAENRHLRTVEERIIAACPELEPLADRGPLYRSRGRVRLGGDPRARFQIVMSKREPQ